LIFLKKRVERIALSGLPFCTEKLVNRGIVGVFAGGRPWEIGWLACKIFTFDTFWGEKVKKSTTGSRLLT
jgi:hypothetical protein